MIVVTQPVPTTQTDVVCIEFARIAPALRAFTLALADLLGETGQIYSIDLDAGALREQTRVLQARFPTVRVQTVTADFTRPLDLPPLDGIVMANALHFVRDKNPVIAQLYRYLKPGGRLLMVEYNVDRGNAWVPYPFSYSTWAELAAKHGFTETRLLTTQPSRFLGEIFSAASVSGILPTHER
jgi:SAM-dependent methyltransferase